MSLVINPDVMLTDRFYSSFHFSVISYTLRHNLQETYIHF